MLLHVSSGKPHQIAPPSAAAEAKHFRDLVEANADWLWEVDPDGRYTYASPKVKEILGYEVEEVLGRTPFDFMAPSEAARVSAEFLEAVAQRRPINGLLNVNLTRQGGEVILETSGVPIFDEQDRFLGYRGVDRDVSAREHTLGRLRLADAAMQHSAEGILVADAQGQLIAVNPAFLAMSGYGEAELLGRPPSMLSSAADPRQRLWDLIGKEGKWSGEGVCRHHSADTFSVWLTLSAVHHGRRVTGYVALISDMTERQLAEATIRFQASHDALTQLANRTAWLAALRHALVEAHDGGARAAVLFVDLDGFKAANDRFGHGVGDTLLSTTARRLERCVRRTDLVARFGGDEFTILLRGHTVKSAPERVAKACVEALAVPFRIDGNDVRISASIGVAVFPSHGRTVDALVASADGAMYVAKRAGGSQVAVAEPVAGPPSPPQEKRKKPRVRASGAAGKRPTTTAGRRGRSASRRRG